MAMRGFRLPRRRPAMWFDGVNDYVIGNITHANIANLNDFQVSCDFWADDTSLNRSLVGFFHRVGAIYYGYNVSLYRNNTIYVWIGGRVTSPYYYVTQMTDAISVKSWHTLQFIFQNGTYYCVVDNVTSTSFNLPINWGDTNVPLVVGVFASNNTNQTLLMKGVIRHINVDGIMIEGNGVNTENWGNGTVYGNPERCLVHTSGAVIRTDPGTGDNYVVR